MNPSDHNSNASSAGPNDFEETLRLLAQLPVPAGLEQRLQARLRTASSEGFASARILPWPHSPRLANLLNSDWMRAAAAAAIVCVVAGGGWGIYSRVQPPQPAAQVAPPRLAAPGGFSSAGAMRTPQTLNGPVVAPQPAVQPKLEPPQPKSSKPAAKPAANRKATHSPAPAPVK